MARGIALLVGLTSVDPAKYGNGWDGVSGAKGCEHDVDNMAEIISSAGEYKINILKTELATASAILTCIESAASTLKFGDIFVFYYSGHGGRKDDTNNDEIDGKDETLVAYDREIIDDDLAERWLKFAPGVRIVMLSDCCHSGTNCGLISMRTIQKATSRRAIQKARKPINFNAKILPEMKAQLIHFGACRDGQDSGGDLLGSFFTLALADVWKKRKVAFSGYEQLHEAIKERLKEAEQPQEPQFNFFGEVRDGFLNSKPFSL